MTTMGMAVPAPEIIVEKTSRGVRIVNRSSERIRIVTATLSYRYTVSSVAAKTQAEASYASKTGSEKVSPMKDLDPGSSFEIEFYPPDILISVELVVEIGRSRYTISRSFV